MSIETTIARELGVAPSRVLAAVRLLDEGATVPFIARYRKEATDGLDDIQLRALEDRLRSLRALEAERERVLSAIAELGLLTPELEAKLREADSLARLEDLYLPYRPKRRTRAQIALEAGLGPLAEALLASAPSADPAALATPFLCEAFPEAKAALDGAREILMQRMAEDADLVETLRERFRKLGRVSSKVREGKEAEGQKFRDWFNFEEPIATLPSHRALALFRGQAEEILSLDLRDPEDAEGRRSWSETTIAGRFGVNERHGWLNETVRLAWRVKLSLRVETTLMGELRARAEQEAIRVFASNLRDLLLAAPAGARVTLGLDPGIRTGVKVAVLDATGKVLDTTTVYPHPPKRDWEGSLRTLRELCRRHGVQLISIGNGTASRETDQLASELIAAMPEQPMTKVVVNEAGASVYSASELASAELPELDVSLRGAVSIGRRLQDPLAELVKIEPRSIGVGQYQHDVDATALGQALDGVVEDCVNGVGVDLNTASPALLQRVAGLGPALARNIVVWRDEHGAFVSRKQLLEVSRLGPKAFEQCAGFLRIRGGLDPLDGSAVHPEAYPVAKKIQAKAGVPMTQLIGNAAVLRTLRPEEFTDIRFGLPTVKDIFAELEKPGRDPRPEFRVARFQEGVNTPADLKPGMVLEGTITNVTAFGAFVDIGVHQDGLVHISQLADRFVRDPREVVKAGDVVTVRVVEVDLPRNRIGLTMRKEGGAEARREEPNRGQRPEPGRGPRPDQQRGPGPGQQRGPRQDAPRPPRDNPQKENPKPADSAGFGTLADLLRGGKGRR